MKAVVYTQYGGPEVLRLKEVDKPVPRDDEILIKVRSVAMNDWDWALLDGSIVNRLMAGLSKPKKQILGSDVAGIVESVGKNVQKFKPGNEVFGDLSGRWGGFAEYVCAPENTVALKLPTMSFEQAASIPQAGMLAVQGLVDKGNLQPGQKLLINGAGGGVGTFGIQMASLLGVEVTAVDKPSKLPMLGSMGAAHVIDYTTQDFTRNGQQYDLILDVKTNRSIFDYLRVLKPGGKYVTVGGSLGRLLGIFLLSPLISLFTKKKLIVVALKPNKDLNYLNGLFREGKLKPVIDRCYSLENVPDAFRYFGSGEHKGKILINIEDTI